MPNDQMSEFTTAHQLALVSSQVNRRQAIESTKEILKLPQHNENMVILEDNTVTKVSYSSRFLNGLCSATSSPTNARESNCAEEPYGTAQTRSISPDKIKRQSAKSVFTAEDSLFKSPVKQGLDEIQRHSQQSPYKEHAFCRSPLLS